MEKEKKVLADVYGFKILSDTIYKVVGKIDTSAPTPFVERGISKVPFEGNKTVVSCLYDNIKNVYDTGFYTASKCFFGEDQNVVKQEVANRVKNILKPYEQITNTNPIQSNEEFWDNKSIDLWTGRYFNTSNPVELFDLYIALLSKSLTPKDREGDPDYAFSMYCVEDKALSGDNLKTRKVKREEISFKYMSAMKGSIHERNCMIDILLFAGVIDNPEIIETDYYTLRLSDYLDGKVTNLEYLCDVMERASRADGEEVFRIYRMLYVMNLRGHISRDKEGYKLNSMVIGQDLKAVADLMVKNKDYADLKIRVMDIYDSLNR